MKTTLIVPDRLLRELEQRAARRGQTLSAVVAEVLRRGLEEPKGSAAFPPLPTHRVGRPTVDGTGPEDPKRRHYREG